MNKFNINQFVKIKLTRFGHLYLLGRHEMIYGKYYKEHKYSKPEEDSEGYSVWQLWVLMGTFGECLHTSNVTTSLPFDPEIILLDKHYKF